MTRLYLLGLVGALFLAGVSWTQSTIPPQIGQALQRRDDLLKNKKIVWDVTISEKYSEEFLKEMASSLDAQRKNLVHLPDYVAIADFSLKGKDPVVEALDRAVSYSWGQYRRFLNEGELKKLFAEQFPASPQKRSKGLRTLLTYAPPLLIIVIGFWWLWKTRKND
ncbi:MAG: hypothetical protein KatS3mg017_0235 [Fimbriimonadales bacterium]|nr:MAG: hypothetical protein KatS3mg017_0235 [Fimbriimonadales bacterium]